MKKYHDKKLLISLFALALFAGISGRIFELMNASTVASRDTSIYSAAAFLATEENLAPTVQK